MKLLGNGPGASRIPSALSNETPDEGVCLKRANDTLGLSKSSHEVIANRAQAWIKSMRARKPGLSTVEGLLHQFPLDSDAGKALMRLGECYLRTPDAHTRALLIGELLQTAQWEGHTRSLKLLSPLFDWVSQVEAHTAQGHSNWVEKLTDPLIQKAVAKGIEHTGSQFLLAQNLEEGLTLAGKKHWKCSFDILGEGARTQEDAEAYFEHYLQAARNTSAPHGLSIKLSALCPRFEDRQRARFKSALIDKVCTLAQACLPRGVPLTIDAEENARLLLTLEVLEEVAKQIGDLPPGLGLAVQAYNRRSLAVIETLVEWAPEHCPQLQIRLVKGAYWDTEIAHAQKEGLKSFPVFTQKSGTDLNYLACARVLLGNRHAVYPMFATHNAYTVSAILRMAGIEGEEDEIEDFEFQRLHGMGESLWAAIDETPTLPNIPRRVYAPVGEYDTALAYLIRRLLENGANSSFVNAVLDEQTPIEALTSNPAQDCVNRMFLPDMNIRPADQLFAKRKNSPGINLNEREAQHWLNNVLDQFDLSKFEKPPALSGNQLKTLFDQCQSAQKQWADLSVTQRAQVFHRWAEGLIKHKESLLGLLITEAGKTWSDAVADWREGIDFLYQHASLGIELLEAQEALAGPDGESNHLTRHARGVCACISPWNFPMAIFIGQISACLIGGNGVLAKAAPQTQRLAQRILDIGLEAGLPKHLVQNLGAETSGIETALKELPVQAVFFTGSNATAKAINQTLANKPGPIIPFVAETGGVNCMIVDSTALLEQACDAIIQSAFGSAGQRCSALRLVFVQEEISDPLKQMVQGAIDLLKIDSSRHMDTDIGPLIDQRAFDRMQEALSHFNCAPQAARQESPLHLFNPVLVNSPLPGDFAQEWFGPLLQWATFTRNQFEEICQQIENAGWGLTLGLQSRLPSRMKRVRQLPVGNVYINRGMTGAVVGSQPFGGQGLSGTGPKAGSADIILRAMVDRCISNNTAALGGVLELMARRKH